MPSELSILLLLFAFAIPILVASDQDQSSIMNIWNYQIDRKIITSVQFNGRELSVWKEVGPNATQIADSRYYVTPPVNFLADSVSCKYVAVMQAYSVVYSVQLWDHELPRAVVERLREQSTNVREDQILPLPFYQARVVWNNPEQQLHGLKLSTAWINNLQQSLTYTFTIAADSNASCQLLADTLRTTPMDIVPYFQLQFTVSAAKIDSKVLTIKSEHIINSQLVASLKNLPGADGAYRYLSSNDYNRMLLQISNQVIATEITNGEFADARDELSLKDTVASMLNAQSVDVGHFEERMWNSTFWDPLDERPDQITKEMNKYFKQNQTDGRWYRTESGSTAGSAKGSGFLGIASAEISANEQHSLTTDQMQHLFEQYDIESNIEGNKFIPKAVDLKRLNMNDLNRGDMVTEKRINIKQVEIGGVLQMAAGNSTLGRIADENRFLRGQIDALQQQLGYMVQDMQMYSSQAANDLKTTKQAIQSQIQKLASCVSASTHAVCQV